MLRVESIPCCRLCRCRLRQFPVGTLGHCSGSGAANAAILAAAITGRAEVSRDPRGSGPLPPGR